MITYIYTLSDPNTGVIKYVGKTVNIKQRYSAHVSDARIGKKNNLVSNWIKSLLNKGLKPTMEIIDEVQGDWEWLEQYWISQFRTWGFKLKNTCDGGGGSVGRVWSNDSINKISQTRINKLKSGEIIPTKHTNEWKQILKDKYAKNDEIIIKLFNQGKSALEISNIVNVTTKTIYQRLNKYSLKYPTNKHELDIDKIHVYVKEGMIYKDIAKIFNVSTSVISSRYRKSKFYTEPIKRWK